MENINTIQTEEKKSLKEVIVENKGKIIVVTGTVAAAVLGGYILSNQLGFDRLTVKLFKKQGELNKTIGDAIEIVGDEATIAKEIAVEGALEEAIKSVKRKIQYRVGKIDGCIKEGSTQALLSKEVYEKELEILKGKLEVFEAEWAKMLH